MQDADFVVDDGEDGSVRLSSASLEEDLSNLLIDQFVFGDKSATLWVHCERLSRGVEGVQPADGSVGRPFRKPEGNVRQLSLGAAEQDDLNVMIEPMI